MLFIEPPDFEPQYTRPKGDELTLMSPEELVGDDVNLLRFDRVL